MNNWIKSIVFTLGLFVIIFVIPVIYIVLFKFNIVLGLFFLFVTIVLAVRYGVYRN